MSARRLAVTALLACLLALAGCGGGATSQQPPRTSKSLEVQHRLPGGQYECLTARGWVPHVCGFGKATAPTLPGTSRPAGPGTGEQFDTVTIATVPYGAPWLAGYTAGYWPTFWALTRLAWHPHVKSIAIRAGDHAACLDVEPGDASPWQAPGWYRAVKADPAMRGALADGKPCLYANWSQMTTEVIPAMRAAGIPDRAWWRWDADYVYYSRIDRGMDCTQWTDHAFGRNLDESTCTLAFLGGQPAPAADVFATFPTDTIRVPWGAVRERTLAQQTDGALQHAARYRDYLTRVLEPRCGYMAARVAWLATHVWGTPRRPGWSHRSPRAGPAGSRYQYLIHAAQGRRIAR